MAWVDPRLDEIIAGHRGVRGVLREIRDDGAARAKALLAPHDQTGGSKITKSRGKIDFFWSLEDADDGPGEPAAYAIEFGYSTDGAPVQGLHIIGRSAGSI